MMGWLPTFPPVCREIHTWPQPERQSRVVDRPLAVAVSSELVVDRQLDVGRQLLAVRTSQLLVVDNCAIDKVVVACMEC